MKHYIVQITSKALDDMDGIYNYIVTQLMAPETAMEQYNRIADVIEKLAFFPERIKVMESEPEVYMELRQIKIDNYSAFYIIRDNKVIVTRVLYGSSDISKKL
ncbi:type II toxin-antitoxin system RelE/ParE family toxin [Sedimentibacter hydroxybenzoicus DSM 7310]|uniref:Type II toxin-antitoxin system RelE/ParE family toxin n=1 Tax=Sedimentibacter hydroxybenzoicus DSM 7310 TaxID=1123245 RepID=A0A974BLK2_SEDHY|nr:type II toxin-antitoxin system RelE/ParE family toxin [Sedimentibacter hydroxybenzoicus]NYB75600.1 type II toxin-antitoxin system RelE/ParE family toxin [Sedimentibacter hydroxybenzoicus DSM 7310]